MVERIIIVGSGIGGLSAAILLAGLGFRVEVVERAAGPGGKIRRIARGGSWVDSGPTVLTMREVFDELFADAGSALDSEITLRRTRILARHAWAPGKVLDLLAEATATADAIGDFSDAANARGYLAFCQRAREIYEILERRFLLAQRPTPVSLTLSGGLAGIAQMLRINPFETLWSALGAFFPDPRLRQLFARYATYCGSSPFKAPATLMLIAHVEQRGVWLVDGGMYSLVVALVRVARKLGVSFRYDANVSSITVRGGEVRGVQLSDGESIDARAVVFNGDAAALGRCLGDDPPAPAPSARSLSAMTMTFVSEASGFPLQHHNVFFGPNYEAEFGDIEQGRLPRRPTVYLCAQDRDSTGKLCHGGAERFLTIVNAPARADVKKFDDEEIAECRDSTLAQLAHCGLTFAHPPTAACATMPQDFDRLFPGRGGAIYGQASHGWMASFTRPGAHTRISGLYLAGGTTHPGPGVPMAAISGRLAAAALIADRASTSRSRKMAISGGISTL